MKIQDAVKGVWEYICRPYTRIGIMGVGALFFGLSLLPKVWTGRQDLYPVKGTLANSTIYIKNVTDSRGHESRAVSIIFYLLNIDKKFLLADNIGTAFFSNKYDHIIDR